MGKQLIFYDPKDLLKAAKAFRERVDALRGELNAVHGWRVGAERWLDSLEQRIAKLEQDPKPDKSVHINTLGLSTRAFNGLMSASITTVDQIYHNPLDCIRNFGKTSLIELNEALIKNGYDPILNVKAKLERRKK